jgi:hypothetical protein
MNIVKLKKAIYDVKDRVLNGTITLFIDNFFFKPEFGKKFRTDPLCIFLLKSVAFYIAYF